MRVINKTLIRFDFMIRNIVHFFLANFAFCNTLFLKSKVIICQYQKQTSAYLCIADAISMTQSVGVFGNVVLYLNNT